MIKKKLSEIFGKIRYRIIKWIIGHTWLDRSENIKERIRRLEEMNGSESKAE